MDIVIIGSGIIGVSTAYYLSQLSQTPGAQIHLIESTPHLFASASGYAGGFLAKDWFTPAASALGSLSFDLHKQLADKHGGREKWDYCPSTALSMTVDDSARKSGRRGEDWLFQGTSRAEVARAHPGLETMNAAPPWMTRLEGESVDIIGSGETTAQVDPFKLCMFLIDSCISQGVRLHYPATPISIKKNASGELSGVTIKSTADGSVHDISCRTILFASGAWTPAVFRELFPRSNFRIPITSLAGHHIVVRSPRLPVPSTQALEDKVEREAQGNKCHAVFSSSMGGFSPEFFSRVSGEIWFGGLNSSTLPLPNLATDAKVEEDSVDCLKGVAKNFLGSSEPDHTDDLSVIRTGVCFRPVTRSGKPILSRVEDERLGGVKSQRSGGVFVAAGHGPWGIALSLGTGLVMAEMIEGIEMSADVIELGF